MNQGLHLRLIYTDGIAAANSEVKQLDVYLDGLQIFSAKPIEDIRVNQLKLANGWHTLDVVAISNHPIRYPTRQTKSFVVGPTDQLPKLSLSADDNQNLAVSIQCEGATQVAIEHLGRRIWESTDDKYETTLSCDQTGYGPVQLRPLARVNQQWIAGEPHLYQVPLPAAEPVD